MEHLVHHQPGNNVGSSYAIVLLISLVDVLSHTIFSPSDAATTSTPAASQKKELTAADLKAEKAAAKAAQKAAREAQQAAAEAALGAKWSEFYGLK